MELTKSIVLDCIQASINAYNGEHGEVKPVFSEVEQFQVDHTEGFFGEKDNILYIVFRGSDGSADWADNFKFASASLYGKIIDEKERKKGPSIEAHHGFLEQYMEVRDLIHEKLKLSMAVQVITTGHSLGAALATLAAFDICLAFTYIDVACVNFGSPRVCTSNFRKMYEEWVPNTLRYKYRNDVVCTVPPVWLGYRHVEKEMLLENEKTDWLFRLMSKILGDPTDHYPQKYLGAIVAGELK